MVFKKLLILSTVFISSVTLAAQFDPTTPSYYLSKELCAEYYTDCIEIYGSAGSGGMSQCGNSLNTCMTSGDWIPPNLPVPTANKLMNLFGSIDKGPTSIETII
ncbi:hypothetical protein [Acinetobacter sp. WZC-1]|uniref:hypothetical protein n=1 Tax=Acinetobacter sp. WZC-1 TaxID=3459034 RepID=UPI00403DD403